MNSNITRLQLPNGSLLRVQGANAQQLADLIAARSPGALLTGNTEEETPLEMPVLNFSKEQPASNSADDEDEEAAMAIPTLSFAGR